MKFNELIQKRLIGFVDISKNDKFLKYFREIEKSSKVVPKLLFLLGDDILKCENILLVNDNRLYERSYYTNWRIIKLKKDIKLELTSDYKSVGEKINEIIVDSDDIKILDRQNINVDEVKWINKVGKGNWLAKPNINYYYIQIKTNTKVISLGTVYHDCHYPECIWDFL